MHVLFREYGDAIVFSKFSYGYEKAGAKVVKDLDLICCCRDIGGKGDFHGL